MAARAIEVIEPRSRSHIQWTPALLRAAEVSADGGHLRLAGELCETMIGDDRIKAVLDTRTDTLLGLPLTFEGRSKRAIRQLEAKEDYWSIFDDTEFKRLHMWGLVLGVGVAQLLWTINAAGRDIPRLVTKNPRNLEWDDDNQRWLFIGQDGKKTPVITGTGEWVLYTPYGVSRPWAFGAWRALSRWALLKAYALTDWPAHSETKGHGILVATGVPTGKPERAQIATDLRNLGRKAVVPLPAGMDLKLLESTARNWETFKAQIDAADNGYAVAILGQNLTTMAGATGNQGAAAIHKDVALGKTKSDNETTSTMAHDQVLAPWAESNFGSRAAAPWPVRDTSTLEDKRGAAAVEQTRAQATSMLKQAGIISLNEARERHGYAKVDGGDEISVTSTPAPEPSPSEDEHETAQPDEPAPVPAHDDGEDDETEG